MKLIQKISSLSISVMMAGFIFSLPVIEHSLGIDVFSNTAVLAADDDDGPRAPPPSRSSQQLSRRVYQRIEEVQEFQALEQYTEARAVLDEIKEMYDDDRLNDREKYMMWVFYANIDQAQENFADALVSYGEIINLENMRPEDIESATRISGQLYFVLEDYAAAKEMFLNLIEISLEPDSDTYLRIAHADYQLENFQDAIPFLLRHVELERASGIAIPESTYSLLGALYYIVEDYPATRQVVRERIVLFNSPSDWSFLAGVNSQLENFADQSYLYYVANVLGYLDDENQLINLAAQLYNYDNPYGGAMIIQRGMDAGLIEENEDNLSFLATTYQIAREDALAIEPLRKAAILSDDGELFARLGNVYSNLANFESAVAAYNNAFEKGDLDREDQVRLRQARAYRELNLFDEGIRVARLARDDERSIDESDTWTQLLAREKEIYETRLARREELAGFFR